MLKTIQVELEVVPLKALGQNLPEIIEDGNTFEENALKKVLTIAKVAPDDYILADDSGLSVPALNGEPGVLSARYAGDHDDDANIDKLLTNLSESSDRKAYFTSVLVLIDKNKRRLISRGDIEGSITQERIGKNGFGYDPIFLVPKFNKTFAELSDEEKNEVSHRGLALKALSQRLPEWLKEDN